jgi:tetratricopeptide (TPR) repeat protein
VKSLACAFAIIGAATVSAAAPVHRTFSTIGVVGSGAAKNGALWFTTSGDDVRFVLAKTSDADARQLMDILTSSNESVRAVTITFNPFAARLKSDGSTIDLPICSVQLEERIFTAKTNCVPKYLGRGGLSSTVRLVALGWAESGQGEEQTAIKDLDRALASKALTKPVEAIARRAHAQSEQAAGYEAAASGRNPDRSWLAALADYRQLAELRPDNADARISEALGYERLGDYEAAEQIYRAALEKWPDERFSITVRLASLARIQGQYQRSLDLLNSLPDEFPDNLGMKFYYHRGWTLTKLGRSEEAISDFTQGLKWQPDYTWAYIRRGCTYANIGRLEFAIGDLETAIGFMQELPYARKSRSTQFNIELANQAIAKLRAAVASRNGLDMPEVCDGFWYTADDKARQRSPLLASE